MTGRLIDLSHPIEHGMTTYPGLPGPVVCDYFSREETRPQYQGKAEFVISKVELVGNTGTYIDAPFHRFEDGVDIAGLPMERIALLPAVVFRTRGREQRAIGPEVFDGVDLAGLAVLVETGWSDHWRTVRYLSGHPFLTASAAIALRNAGAALVGIDSLNIDDMDDLARPVHTILLGAGIPVVEHLTGLDGVPDRGFRFTAAAAPVVGCGTFPVRAFAALD
jgi:kynurenine formamidase